jgi:chromosome segregation ATPase
MRPESQAAVDFCPRIGQTDARMKNRTIDSFNERAAASAAAKQALLAKMKTKPTVTAPEGVVDRAARREAELAEVRARREAERAEKRRKLAETEALRREIEEFNRETAELEARANQKAARLARYAGLGSYRR